MEIGSGVGHQSKHKDFSWAKKEEEEETDNGEKEIKKSDPIRARIILTVSPHQSGATDYRCRSSTFLWSKQSTRNRWCSRHEPNELCQVSYSRKCRIGLLVGPMPDVRAELLIHSMSVVGRAGVEMRWPTDHRPPPDGRKHFSFFVDVLSLRRKTHQEFSLIFFLSRTARRRRSRRRTGLARAPPGSADITVDWALSASFFQVSISCQLKGEFRQLGGRVQRRRE